MSQHQVQSLLVYFTQIFLLCKVLGLYPHDWQAFHRDHVLQKSKPGTWIVLTVLLGIVVFYNLLIFSFSEEDSSLKATQSTLTYVIGLFLTYIGLIMMVVDQWYAVRNQAQIGELYERIRIVDERLYKEHIVADSVIITRLIRFMITLTISSEIIIFVSTYLTLVDYSQLKSVLWIFSSFPTLYNSLDKIWFAITLFALRQRFRLINGTLEEMVESHEKFKQWMSGDGGNGGPPPALDDKPFDPNMEYLYRELNNIDAFKARGGSGSGKNKVAPIAHSMNSFGEDIDTPQKQNKKPMINMAYESELTNIPRIEEKLNSLCQLHDEICEIGKLLNELWSYPILVLMAYGFLIFTAQLYFLYCATQNQAIPSLFRSAKNAAITIVYLSYTAGKCIYLIYLSWKTSLESKRTGICLHKCGVVADDNQLYEIVNHLSLKLLNHSVDFSACGFFTLDMETLYGVSGGITSYLIILIQFNLAAQQAKDAIQTFSNFNETANYMAGVEETNITSLMNLMTTTILPNNTEPNI